jgi:hypothetical protein
MLIIHAVISYRTAIVYCSTAVLRKAAEGKLSHDRLTVVSLSLFALIPKTIT